MHIAPKCGTEHIRDRWRAISPRYRNRAEIAVLMCEPVIDPDLQITGGGGASVWSKTKGEGSLPWIRHYRIEALSDVVRVPPQKLSGIVWILPSVAILLGWELAVLWWCHCKVNFLPNLSALPALITCHSSNLFHIPFLICHFYADFLTAVLCTFHFSDSAVTLCHQEGHLFFLLYLLKGKDSREYNQLSSLIRNNCICGLEKGILSNILSLTVH